MEQAKVPGGVVYDRRHWTRAVIEIPVEGLVTRTGITDLDFDVEQPNVMDAASNQRRAQALAAVQARHPEVRVSFTLAAIPRDRQNTPGGLAAAALDVVQKAIAAGVKITRVNLMTMDYGGYYSTGMRMSDLAISALTETKGQLAALFPGKSDADLWKMLGATPMIGQNDIASEVFSLDDARALADFARAKLGLVSFWAIQRDQPCGATGGLGLCSQVNTARFQFHQVLRTVR